MRIDARLPVRFGPLESRRAHEAVLSDGALAGPPFEAFTAGPAGHPMDCACCVPRSGAAMALAALFRARATGTGPAFRGVLAVVGPDGEAAVRAALTDDAMASGRFRLTEGAG